MKEAKKKKILKLNIILAFFSLCTKMTREEKKSMINKCPFD